MEVTNTEDGVYQLYTIIDGSDKLFLQSQAVLLPNAAYQVGDNNSIVFLTLPENEEEEVVESTAVNADDKITSDNCKVAPESSTSLNTITVELEPDMYLASENLVGDPLVAVEPHFLTGTSEEMEAVENLQAAYAKEHTDNLDNSNLHKIQLEDGTCAIINATLWNSLLENSSTIKEERETVKKKNFPCTFAGCGKSFSTAHHLSVHTRNHTGSRPYVCNVKGCIKAFATGYSLKAHLRTHTGEKPYGCPVCMKHFKTSGDLQKHVRTHTGEKPFKCPVEGCDKCFTTSNIRKVHIRSHTGERPYKCKVPNCGKAFASATNYKNHTRIHSGEKPYACQIPGCYKRFTEYSSLYKHSAVHQPYKTFQCNYCKQHFKFENTLRLHKKTVHSIVITENGTEYLLSDDDAKSIVFELSGMKAIDPALAIFEDGTNSEEENV